MNRKARMVELLNMLAPREGYTLARLEGLKFMRANCRTQRMPVLYEPCIVIVGQGCKRGYVGDESFDYDAQHFLVMSVPLPFEGETVSASEAEPMLAIKIPVDLKITAELAMALDAAGVPMASAPRAFMSSPVDDRLCDSVLRLLEALASPLEADLIGPGLLREIVYRVLTGPQGAALRAALAHQSHFGKIGKALRRIHSDYSLPIDVATLAREAGMSLAAFHASFKEVTTTSPIQYLKTTRLHKARLLMVQDGLTAATACSKVGYESTSQFSREFKRFFGRTPVEEAREMRQLLAQQRGDSTAGYVTVQ